MYYAFSTSTKNEFQCEYAEDVFCVTHVHGYFELIFVMDGEINIQTENGSESVGFGNMAIIMPYEAHGFKTLKNSKILIMEFPVEYVSEYKMLFEGKIFKNHIVEMSDLLRAMIYELIENRQGNRFNKKTIIYRSFFEFMNKTELIPQETVPDDIFRKAVMYISKHFSENLTQKKVASEIGVSTVHLSRVLNRRQNMGFTDIINSARIKEAKRLMEETDIPVTDVAFSVGFGSIRNFNRICRQYFNCTPTNLRNSEKVEFVSKKELTHI